MGNLEIDTLYIYIYIYIYVFNIIYNLLETRFYLFGDGSKYAHIHMHKLDIGQYHSRKPHSGNTFRWLILDTQICKPKRVTVAGLCHQSPSTEDSEYLDYNIYIYIYNPQVCLPWMWTNYNDSPPWKVGPPIFTRSLLDSYPYPDYNDHF